mmetsp:Transcript_22110/g.54715  ORF Transcript_22110/g.54715 Transcript_22110/m.54715 type:complete len:236 (+) Transcript_22110:184-891(+)
MSHSQTLSAFNILLRPYTVGTSEFSPARKAKAGHLKVARLLLDAGCRVNPKDVAGHTPLHHCCTAHASPVSLEIASLLIAHGHSAEETNRAGYPPIVAAAMARKLAAAELLLGAGADVTVPIKTRGYPDMAPKRVMQLWGDGMAAISEAGGALKRAAKESPDRKVLCGQRVVVKGLQSTTELNGQHARCGELKAEKGRYVVHLADGTVKFIKPANLDILEEETAAPAPAAAEKVD